MKYSALREKIRAYCNENNVFGILRVTLKDEILFEDTYGYADVETKREITKETPFTLYSISKAFCTIGLMKLCDRGLVSLSDHPAKYLPEAAGLDARLTIENMLYHRSGIPYFTKFDDIIANYSSESSDEIRKALRALAEKPLNFPPDTDCEYSNMNMLIPALIIENVTGRKYADYMRDEVFLPLGMTTAFVDDRSPYIKDGAIGHSLIDGKITKVPRVTDWYFGAGDAVGTVDDVYALNLAVKHKRLLTEASWKRILTLHPKCGFGLGCIIIEDWYGKFRIQHNGGSRGFRTLHIHLPEDDLDIILLSNSDITDARYPIAEMIYEGLYGASDTSAPAPEMDKGYI